jgi:hypothetical protein
VFAEPAVIVRTSASVAALTAFNDNHQSVIVDSTSERSNAKVAVGSKEEAGAANDAAFWLLRFPRLGPLFDSWTRVGSLPSGEQAKLLELLDSALAAAPDASSSAASSSSAAAAAESVQFFGKMVVDTLESIKSFPSQQYVPCHLRHAYLVRLNVADVCQLIFVLLARVAYFPICFFKTSGTCFSPCWPLLQLSTRTRPVSSRRPSPPRCAPLCSTLSASATARTHRARPSGRST